MTQGSLCSGLCELSNMVRLLKSVDPVSRDGDSRWHVPVPHDAVRGHNTEIQTEIELALLLFGLALQLKPQVVIESGTDLGITTAIMGLACKLNGFGEVLSAEIDYHKVIAARERCEDLPVRILHGDSIERLPFHSADLGFLDGAQENRLEEMRRMKAGSTAVIHDTKLMSNDELKLLSARRPLMFETSRGFAVVKK